LAAASEVTPIARLNPAQLAEIREYCRQGTYPVNGEVVKDTGRKQRKVSMPPTATADASQN